MPTLEINQSILKYNKFNFVLEGGGYNYPFLLPPLINASELNPLVFRLTRKFTNAKLGKFVVLLFLQKRFPVKIHNVQLISPCSAMSPQFWINRIM